MAPATHLGASMPVGTLAGMPSAPYAYEIPLELFRGGRRRRQRGVSPRNSCLGSRVCRHLLPLCVFHAPLRSDRWLLRSLSLFSSPSLNPGAVGNQGPKFRRELLYSFLSFSFGLRGVGSLSLRLNDATARQGFFPLLYCFLSLHHCFLTCIQLRFALSRLCFSGRILLLAGANHCQRDEN